MKGVVCSHLYSIEEQRTANGSTMAIKDLVNGAIGKGLNVEVVIRFFPLVSRKGVFFPRKRSCGPVTVYDVPKVGFRDFYLKFLTGFILRIMGFSGRYDFALCHMCSNFEPSYELLNKKNVQKHYFVVHSSDLKTKNIQACLHRADKVFARSMPLASQVESVFGVRVDGVIYSGIDESLIVESRPHELSNKTLRIVMACVFLPLKNIESCLEACAKIVGLGFNVYIELYGDGPLKKNIISKIDDLGLGAVVNMHGFQPRSSVINAMRKADLFLMPSSPETFGLAFLEAMASGCVVIGHKGWGIDGIVEDGRNGYLVGDAAPRNIAEKIIHYLSNDDRQAMHDESIRTALSYTKEKSYDNLVQLIEGN